MWDLGCPVRLARLGHRVFIPATGVRIPYGTPLYLKSPLRSLNFSHGFQNTQHQNQWGKAQ